MPYTYVEGRKIRSDDGAWAMLSSEKQAAASALGWTSELWDDPPYNDGPDPDDTPWDKLEAHNYKDLRVLHEFLHSLKGKKDS